MRRLDFAAVRARTRRSAACGLAGAAWLALAGCAAGSGTARPAALSDEAFWQLTTDLSEPPGTFTHSDNLVSNEARYVHTVRLLAPAAGAYVGVGPEQNFSYIARLQPPIAFIVDVRAENRSLHLLYKALFEIAADRADFAARLFSRDAPPGLRPGASADELFAAFDRQTHSPTQQASTLAAVRARLVDHHRWPLTARDLDWIAYTLAAFAAAGPAIHYGRGRDAGTPAPTYRALMTARDLWGDARSYLATEDTFAAVKDLHARNLIVPVVGDFAGAHALRRIAAYLRAHEASLSAFYASNVEVYLTRQQVAAFCANLAMFPAAPRAVFLDGTRVRPFADRLAACAPVAQ